jgi:adenylate cyclase
MLFHLDVTAMNETRKLAAILVADVVGYSRLAGADEDRTLARLRSLRSDLIDPTIAVHRGRVVKRTGDGTLVEFRSVVDAVRCAIEVQQGMTERNAGVPADRRIEFRIGIHLGDVVEETDGDLMGDGINVAARLEGICEAGAICISEDAYRQVRDKVSERFLDIGERALKNIARPVRAYQAIPGGGAAKAEAVRPAPGLAVPDKPSIAVLPFQNMSGDPEQEYFADGMVEDIITGLSRVRALFVIARNSTFAYKGKAVAVTQVARDLGVRYVLEGSIRKSGARVRITAQLVDATDGHHVWAEKFDRELIEIFDLQDEITRSVVASAQTQILLAEGDPSVRRDRPDLSVWSLVNRAMARIHDLTPESLAEGRQLAEEALSIDRRCGPAWRCLSIAIYHQAHMLAASDYDAAMSEALETAERSIQLDSRDEYAHWNLGNVLVALRQHDRAIAALERATEINPNYSTAVGSLGTALSYGGRPSEGIVNNEVAIRSDPLNPSIFFRYSGLALGHYLVGDYGRSAEWAKKSIRRNRHWYLGHVYFIAAVAQLDRIDEARSALQDYLALFPRASISELRRLPLKIDSDFEHLCAGLRKAGLPE